MEESSPADSGGISADGHDFLPLGTLIRACVCFSKVNVQLSLKLAPLQIPNTKASDRFGDQEQGLMSCYPGLFQSFSGSPQRHVVCFLNVNVLLFFPSLLKIVAQLLAKAELLAFWDKAANPTCLRLAQPGVGV